MLFIDPWPFGVDSAQALLLVFAAIRAHIDRMGEGTFTWLGGFAEIGFPRTVPSWEWEHQKRVERGACIDERTTETKNGVEKKDI
jgi:hypothetical protein